MKEVYCLAFFVFSCLLASAQKINSDYKIYSTAQKKEVSIDEIVSSVSAGQVLIFGEQHDDSTGHKLESAIFESLHTKFNDKLILSMEMFQRDIQYILDEYLSGQISEKNFVAEARAWPAYKTDYRPMIEFAKQNHLAVIAANSPSRYTNLVTRQGLGALKGLNKDVRKNYLAPLPVDTLSGTYYANFLKAMGGHSVPGMNLYQSQNLWDATMAWSIAQAMKKDKSALVFQLNGRFHSDDHDGLVYRLATDYKKNVVTISCFSDDQPESVKWDDYSRQADFIIVTKGRTQE